MNLILYTPLGTYLYRPESQSCQHREFYSSHRIEFVISTEAKHRRWRGEAGWGSELEAKVRSGGKISCPNFKSAKGAKAFILCESTLMELEFVKTDEQSNSQNNTELS